MTTNYLFCDQTFILYVLLVLIGTYGTLLFLWWWRKNKWRASPMYAYVTFLMFGITIESGVEGYARFCKICYACTPEIFNEVITSSFWPMRLWAILLGITAIVTHMSYRAFIIRPKQTIKRR